MDSTKETPAPPPGDLAAIFGRIAADPERTGHLHRVLGPFCHESRNILNGIKMSLYLASRCGGPARSFDPGELAKLYETLERYIDRIHQLCRPVRVQPVRLPLDLLFEERRVLWERQLEAARVRLVFEGPDTPLTVSLEPGLLGRALDDLVVWRARHAPQGGVATLSWQAERDSVLVQWSEHTPGGEAAVTPGRSQSPTPTGSDAPDAVGLDALELFAIPILTRVVALHGGSLETADRDGWRLRVRWPIDERNRP
jgi:hypothetical protein